LPRLFSQYVIDPEKNITFAVVGLAVAFTIASFINMIILFVALHRRLGDLKDTSIVNSLTKILIASGIMGAAIQGLKYLVSPIINPKHPVLGFATQTLIVVFAGAGIYFLIAYLFRCDEMKGFKKIFQRPNGLVRESKELER